MATQIKFALMTLVLTAAISCSVNKKQVTADKISPDQVAFIEYIQTQNGETLKGTAPQGRRVDGPTYRFDKATKQLNIIRKQEFQLDTVKAVLGNVRVLKGTAGTGLSMRLNFIGKFPYTSYNLTVSKVSRDGISIIFDKKEHLLKEGEVWETSTIDTSKIEPSTVIKTTTTYSIQYHGLIDKKGITQ